MGGERKTLRWPLGSAVVLGGALHGLASSQILGAHIDSPWFWVSWAIACALLWRWPLVRPGWRALLIVAPVMSGSFVVVLGLTLFIVILWRNALGTQQLTPRAWLETVIAAAIGGPMTAILFTPLLVDARPLYERTEAFDVSRFQRILITRSTKATRLWLDGNHQLSSTDERSYHEALVRPVMSHRPQRVLILGGGDGLAAREVLLHDFVTQVTMVELDARVPALVRRSSLGALTGSVFDAPRLRLVEADAIAWLGRDASRFDAIVVDFPDPTTPLLAGLFAVETWKAVAMRLAHGGVIALQSSSLLYPRVVASIAKSVAAAGLQPLVYSREIESFGSNAFILVGDNGSLSLRTTATTLESDEALRALVSGVVVDDSAPIVTRRDAGSLRTLAAAASRLPAP